MRQMEAQPNNELIGLRFSSSVKLISDDDLKKKIEKVKAELEKINQKKEVDDEVLQVVVKL